MKSLKEQYRDLLIKQDVVEIRKMEKEYPIIAYLEYVRRNLPSISNEELVDGLMKILYDFQNGTLKMTDKVSYFELLERDISLSVLRDHITELNHCFTFQYNAYGYRDLGCSNPNCKKKHDKISYSPQSFREKLLEMIE